MIINEKKLNKFAQSPHFVKISVIWSYKHLWNFAQVWWFGWGDGPGHLGCEVAFHKPLLLVLPSFQFLLVCFTSYPVSAHLQI